MSEPSPNPPILDNLRRGRILIGMVHVHATPGTPRACRSVGEIVDLARSEASQLTQAGFDAVIVENMHDAPYVHGPQLGPEQTATMTMVVSAVRDVFTGPVGVQILSGGNREALAVALATGASFIRCENFVFSHVADEGLLERAEAGPLLRYRRSIGAEHVAIFADIKKKHASHALTADVSVGDAVEAAAFFGADGVIVTGSSTGRTVDPLDLGAARAATDRPVLVGSGVETESVPRLFEHADALIVGSALKRDGHWANELDPAQVDAIVASRDRIG